MWDWSKSLCLIFGLKLTKCFHMYPFHSHDLNINSPHSLSYIAYSVSSENLVLNQTKSPFFLILITYLLNNVMILQGEIIYWSLLGVKGMFTVSYSLLHWFIWNQHNNQLPVSLSAQLIEHCTGIAEVMPYFHFCSSTVYHCKDRFHFHFFICSSQFTLFLYFTR